MRKCKRHWWTEWDKQSGLCWKGCQTFSAWLRWCRECAVIEVRHSRPTAYLTVETSSAPPPTP